MATMVMNEIVINSVNRLSVHVDFKGPVTSIGGEGATGKTYLMNRLKGEFGILDSTVKDLDKIELISSSDFSLNTNQSISQAKTKLKSMFTSMNHKFFIIDNVDVLFPILEITRHDLQNSDNQFLLFSRFGRQYGATAHTMGIFYIEDNVLRSMYL